MVGAVQLGIIAACVVLFVPMGMAGWHLSRNRMLFFSAALFITLAIGVHIIPYLPDFPTLIIQSFTFRNPNPKPSCLNSLHHIDWQSISNDTHDWNWKTGDCSFVKLKKSDALDLLNGTWISVVGDSQSRFFTLSLLELMLNYSVREDLFKRHSNYSATINDRGIKIDFIWAPYEDNATEFLHNLKQESRSPDVLIMGTGLWHMLHVSSSGLYALGLQALKSSAVSILPLTSEGVPAPHMFWLGLPHLVNSMLNTDEKKEKMKSEIWDAYDAALVESRLLRENGGPFVLLDMEKLSSGCGEMCTEDGMHYHESVYEASVQIMLNALLIESDQVPAR